jgi:hypothetical protein
MPHGHARVPSFFVILREATAFSGYSAVPGMRVIESTKSVQFLTVMASESTAFFPVTPSSPARTPR